ncbi:uncharacterized protein GLRG_09048, partial [Colletotrichum graminicola M1.001]
ISPPCRNPSRWLCCSGTPLEPVNVPGATPRYRSPLASDQPSSACRHISLTPSSNTPPSYSFQAQEDLQTDRGFSILTRAEHLATC